MESLVIVRVEMAGLSNNTGIENYFEIQEYEFYLLALRFLA
jgi:hypothetical protein